MKPAIGLVACHECDLLQRAIVLAPGGEATCSRCGAVLYRDVRGALDRSLALLLASILVFLLANATPIVALESRGNHVVTTLFGAVRTLWLEHMEILSVLVFATTILAPALELAILALLLIVVRRGLGFPALPALLRTVLMIEPWNMVEVFLLGVLVSVVKLSHLAHIVPGVALWAYGALILLLAALTARFSARDLWSLVPSGR